MRGLRTIPVLLDVCRDLEELSPGRAAAQLRQPDGDALLGGRRGVADPDRRALPLGAAHRRRAGRGPRRRRDVDYHVAGINHVAFFLELEHEGVDLYPALREVEPPDWNRVRYELFKHFGYFVTESSEHFAEYSPWFIKDGREDLIERVQRAAGRVPAPL